MRHVFVGRVITEHRAIELIAERHFQYTYIFLWRCLNFSSKAGKITFYWKLSSSNPTSMKFIRVRSCAKFRTHRINWNMQTPDPTKNKSNKTNGGSYWVLSIYPQ